MNKYFIYMLISLLLASCTANDSKIDKSSTPVFSERKEVIVGSSSSASTTINSSYPSLSTKSLIIYKSILLPHETIDINFVNFIYLPRKPISIKEKEQYNLICELWLNSFPKINEVKPYLDSSKELAMPLYWPLVKNVKDMKCKELIEAYDYSRMNVYMNRNKLVSTKLQLVGQFDKVFVSMNLSNVFDIESLSLGFNNWKSHMTTIPKNSSKIEIYSLIHSFKKVLGVLGDLVSTKSKG